MIVACASGTLGSMAPRAFAAPDPAADWSEYLGGPDRNHYSRLTQIDPRNVAQLKPAWEYHTGSVGGWLECNPIVVAGTLFGATTASGVFALDAATGRERWRFVPPETPSHQPLRGVVYWADGDDQRILFTVDSWLCAIDARDGKPIASFGSNGRVSLKAGLGASARDRWVVSTTPGTVLGDLIVMPLRVSEGPDAGPGFIQAFNVRTGQLAWVFHTIPQPGEPGYETWSPEAYRNISVGAANCWAGMAVDRERGIIYASTGSASPDFWGADRKGQNLYADCVLALDGRTGKRLWHFQLVHHDLWDMDPPAPPNLVTVTAHGRKVDAVAQVTKFGDTFVFDRVTGQPLFPITEVAMPASNLPGEQSWPTQPRPAKPTPFARQTLGDDDISPYAPNRAELLTLLHRADRGLYHPILPGQETIVLPGFDGGAEWGGAAADPDGILYVNANEVARIAHLRKVETVAQLAQLGPGSRLYAAYCIACHGADRKGNATSGFPSLVGLATRRTRDEVIHQITVGKGMMPGFPMLTAEDRQRLTDYLFDLEPGAAPAGARADANRFDLEQTSGHAGEPVAAGAPTSGPVSYTLDGYIKFLDRDGYPAITPPWGSLTAIDLNTGELRWRITLGEFPELSAKGIPPTGTENYGGPLVTAGGVLFIAATPDRQIRALDRRSGRLLWSHALPTGGFATPSTYAVGGRQFVVIACGGDRLGNPAGDAYVAFALP